MEQFRNQFKNQFVQSWKEFRQMHTIVITAMMIAIAVVLGFFSIQVTDFLKLGVSFLANELTALLFGPAVGGIMAGTADIIKYLVHPTGPFFFGFTFDAIVGGVIYGVILYRKPISFKRILLAKAVVMVVVNICLNTYWLTLLYGSPLAAILPMRILKQCIMLPIESILFYTVAKMLLTRNVLAQIRKVE